MDWTDILKKAGIPEPPWEDADKYETTDIELEEKDDDEKDNWMQL